MLMTVCSNVCVTSKSYVLLLFIELEVSKLCVNLQINMLADSKAYVILQLILLVWRFLPFFDYLMFVDVFISDSKWAYCD